jgi:YesN/AraC family two-component response regulator
VVTAGRVGDWRDRILVVVDDQRVREVLALSLGGTYDVKQAATGAEALGVVSRVPLAAVILDYRLPDQTGLEVLSQIRSTDPGLPVVMITGYGSEGVCASALKLGIRDYFPKPQSVFDLRRSLDQILSDESRRGHRELGDRGRGQLVLARLRDQPDLRIQKIVAMIQHHYWNHLTLPMLAREVGMSKCGLSRRFREVMGMTLRGYLMRVRLEKAQDLLIAKQAPITEIALAVGFGDLPRFDKVFKRYSGCTPSAYRSRTFAESNK